MNRGILRNRFISYSEVPPWRENPYFRSTLKQKRESCGLSLFIVARTACPTCFLSGNPELRSFLISEVPPSAGEPVFPFLLKQKRESFKLSLFSSAYGLPDMFFVGESRALVLFSSSEVPPSAGEPVFPIHFKTKERVV